MGQAMIKTYSLTVQHVQKVADLAKQASQIDGRDVSQGEIVRRAIDLLAERMEKRLHCSDLEVTSKNLDATSNPGIVDPAKD